MQEKEIKWIIVTGGVLSGLGKGVATASIGKLLPKNKKIVTIKCDGYLNVDPGTMNPIEHGEVFVLDDGGEVDMDFGHYERFLGISCKFSWNLTSGKIFNTVIQKERRGDYLGKTIQIFPHIPEEIKAQLFKIAVDEKADIMMIEIGGTVGDIENSWFLEAIRQLKKTFGRHNTAYIHLTYIPFLNNVGELKTKPAQRDIGLLRQIGITPDIVICRSKEEISKKIKQKIAKMCDLEEKQIISGHDIKNTIYEIPLVFQEEGVYDLLKETLKLDEENDLKEWKQLVEKIKNPEKEIKIAICGKYTDLKDSYASIIEALKHSGAHTNSRINIKWIETTDIEQGKMSASEILKDVKGVIVPGGFGSRGAEGKIEVIKNAREKNIPFLGLCYGLQLGVIEYARNICRLNEAGSSEINEKSDQIVCILPEQAKIMKKGGTMRLGNYEAVLEEGSKVKELYNADVANERHRHRFEVNPKYHSILKEKGLKLSGMNQEKTLVEFIELPEHKYFLATQAHPELKSRLEKPAPLFLGFVKACLEK